MTSKTIFDEAEFERRFGRKPQNDDLDRVNCTCPGEIGHFMCGVCEHDRPCFECTVCFALRIGRQRRARDAEQAKGEIWERIGVDVVISDDPDPEALHYARKCACGNLREHVREPNSSVHVILPCEVCEK